MENLTFTRKGQTTRVFLDGDFIGLIIRREVSNASARGGAYRTMHYAKPITKLPMHPRGYPCYTRKEAAEFLVNRSTDN